MRVQRVLMPDGSESWTVLNAGGDPVPAVEAFLAHLQDVGSVPDHGSHIRDEPDVVVAVPGPAGRARRQGDGGARLPVRGVAAGAGGQRDGAGRPCGSVRPGDGEQASGGVCSRFTTGRPATGVALA